MAATKTNEMKFTLWTENGLRVDVPSGTISACVILAFQSIASTKTRTPAEHRKAVLMVLESEHKRLLSEGL